MMSVLAWLAGSRLGRWLASSLLVIALIGGIILTAYRRGRSSEKSEQNLRALNRLKERIRVDESIRHMPADERRRRLSDDWAS